MTIFVRSTSCTGGSFQKKSSFVQKNMMDGIILSSWDHIMGPQVEKFWYPASNDSIKLVEIPGDILKHFNVTKHFKDGFDFSDSSLSDLRTYSIMCGQLLLGEVDSRELCDEWVSRFYLSETKILVSVVFHLNSWECTRKLKTDKDLCLCFGTIFKRHALKFALEHQHIIDIQLRKAVDVMQNSKIPFDFLMKEITHVVNNLAMLLESLKKSNLKFLQPLENHSIQDLIQSELVTKAIVSHLQTSGYTVVLGTSDFLINQIIYLLSLLSLQGDNFSTFPNVTSSFIRGVHIQSSRKTTEVDYKCLSEIASKDSISLTIIDVDSAKVWQSVNLHNPSDSSRNSLSLTVETGEIVPLLLQDLYFIHKNEGDSKCFVENFFKYLMVEAASLIKAIEPFRNTPHGFNEKVDVKMFSSYNMVDFRILLGCAEKLKPGIRKIFPLI